MQTSFSLAKIYVLIHMVVVVLEFYVPPTAKVIRRRVIHMVSFVNTLAGKV